MIPLVLWLGLAAQAPVSPPLDSVAAERCRSVFARKLGLNIGPVTVAERRRLRGSTLLEGSFSGYRPPTPPSPGMAAPLHVIDVRYDYRCWLRHGSVSRVWTHKVGE